MPNAPKKVLIVEDEFLMAFMLQVCFEQLNFEVIGTVDTAEEAIDFAKTNLMLSLISMDITLASERNGVEAAEAIRSLGIQTPILFVSANIDMKKRTKNIKNTAFAEKPASLESIKRAVNQLLSEPLK